MNDKQPKTPTISYRWKPAVQAKEEALFARLAEFEKWNAETTNLIVGTSPPDGLKYYAVARLLQTTLEHTFGISILLKNGAISSALALARSPYEAYVKGIYILRCATDREAERYSKGKDALPEFGKMNEAVDQTEGTEYFSKLKNAYWKKLNDHTHSGGMHIMSGLTTPVIQSNYGIDDALGLLKTSTNLAVMAAGALAIMNGREDLARTIDRRFSEIFARGWG
jgi:hypothetical protein